jgi:hypothetical protein
MAETLLQYQQPVVAPDGNRYEARACGSPIAGGVWQGWIEFVPLDHGAPVRTGRETTQPNRVDTAYWATGLSPVYLEGALARALTKRVDVEETPPPAPIFSGPAPSSGAAHDDAVAREGSVLNPFSVYEKGEALLRRQLAALSAWHLVNIIIAYELSDQRPDALNTAPAAALIDIIVSGVRERTAR